MPALPTAPDSQNISFVIYRRIRPLVVEFVDFGGEMRRDIWHAFIKEVISVYGFIREYGPEDGDNSVHHVHGAHGGTMRAVKSAINGITRMQGLQFIRKLPEDPIKVAQFSYLRDAPFGDIVYQTLAVHFWGGPLVSKFTESGWSSPAQVVVPLDGFYDVSDNRIQVFDLDGSVYLRKWMRSASWASKASISFWKNSSLRQGLVLSKNLVVADKTLVERAAEACKERSHDVERTQATIDAATLKGIPSNIDLFQELMLPLSIALKNFEKLRQWEEPHKTISFLAFAYIIIFRNMLRYIFPTMLMIVAASMLLFKGLREQGRLGRSFGRVTIRDQPPSNTIQTLMAIKQSMLDVESYLQNMNVILLKIRAIILSGQPQVTTEVALVLLSFAVMLLIVPFRYVLAFFLFDLFTRALEFRKETVTRFMSFLKERWNTVPATPVVVLPYESNDGTESGTSSRDPVRGSDFKQNQTEHKAM
ncbi:hypothetical protein Scep_019161 [Stephania cephalantha]|uniref:Uncharacterized protein n=1 Tax=Stephania cephalantha TaxID=152367 RepID=A0AAP0IAI8_9MAGN